MKPRNSRRLWLLALPALLAAGLWRAKVVRENSTEILLTRYEKDAKFNRVLSMHKHSLSTSHGTVELLVTYPLDSKYNRVRVLSVKNSGMGYFHVYDGTHYMPAEYPYYGDGRDYKLNAQQIEALQNGLGRLPQNEVAERKHLLIVSSFHLGKSQTRLYDRANLPPQMREIYRITGAPLEEVNR